MKREIVDGKRQCTTGTTCLLVGRVVAISSIVALSMVGAAVAQEDGEAAQRRIGLREVERVFLRKVVQIDANLVRRSGPEWMKQFTGKELKGCPSQPITEPSDIYSESFRVGGPRTWAGLRDGVNTVIRTPTGVTGNGVARPSNSSFRLPQDPAEPRFSFVFDGTLNVQRPLIDEANERFDACASRVRPGTYGGDQLSKLCPYPKVSVEQAGQTCALMVYGDFTERLPDQGGYKVIINKSTVCDFTGINGSASTSTAFQACYNEQYEGVARISSGSDTSPEISLAEASAQRRCKKASRKGGKRGQRQMEVCISRAMQKAMQRR